MAFKSNDPHTRALEKIARSAEIARAPPADAARIDGKIAAEINHLEARVRARFTLLHWLIGLNLAATCLLLWSLAR